MVKNIFFLMVMALAVVTAGVSPAQSSPNPLVGGTGDIVYLYSVTQGKNAIGAALSMDLIEINNIIRDRIVINADVLAVTNKDTTVLAPGFSISVRKPSDVFKIGVAYITADNMQWSLYASASILSF